MSDLPSYVDYFYTGGGQFLIIFGALATLASLAAMGRALFAGHGLAEADFFAGWAIVVLALTVGNIFFRIPFNYVFWPLAAVGAGLAVWYGVRERRAGPAGFWRVVVLAAPLVLIASARMASEWDEFSHWLPTARFIFEAQQFPFGGREVSGGYFPGYPYTWLFLVYMANMAAGQLVEAAGSVLNILLLLTFGTGAYRLWCEAAGNPVPASNRLAWSGALFAVLAATLLNPTFVQKVIMTTYADASTATAVGIGTVLAYFILDALAQNETERARVLAWQFGLAMAVLINIKQSNLVLVVMLLGGMGVVALRDPAIRFPAMLKLIVPLLAPAVLIYAIWRYHVMTNLPHGAEAVFLPYEDWNTHVLWPILKQMLVVASKKSAYFGVMAIAVVAGIIGLLRCSTPFHRLAMLVGASFLGYNAFLYLIFVTQFGEHDALRVASYWRYNHHLGLMAVAFGAFALGLVYRRHLAGRGLHRVVMPVLIAVVAAAPFVFAEKLRFDLEHPKPFYRSVGRELPDLMPEGARMIILDPLGTGESAVLTLYGLNERRGEFISYRAAYHDFNLAPVREMVTGADPDHILVHSMKPVVNEVLGTELPLQGYSYLLRKSDGEPVTWEVVKKWPRSDGHWAGR
ncbi:MAG: hypothetical protein JJ900_16025 [Rhodospirillales bacterium]|nr:hypothetical protein [Rhodospirillales bacterium]MBO6788356.1 hypothetical protein [Rhodospirillales bacterium]